MTTILATIKPLVGVTFDNLGFDAELLVYINSAAGELTQLGVTEFEELEIDAQTSWPVFGNTALDSMVRHFMGLMVRKSFDPIPSETIAKSFNMTSDILQGRISNEVEVLSG